MSSSPRSPVPATTADSRTPPSVAGTSTTWAPSTSGMQRPCAGAVDDSGVGLGVRAASESPSPPQPASSITSATAQSSVLGTKRISPFSSRRVAALRCRGAWRRGRSSPERGGTSPQALWRGFRPLPLSGSESPSDHRHCVGRGRESPGEVPHRHERRTLIRGRSRRLRPGKMRPRSPNRRPFPMSRPSTHSAASLRPCQPPNRARERHLPPGQFQSGRVCGHRQTRDSDVLLRRRRTFRLWTSEPLVQGLTRHGINRADQGR